MCAQGGALSHRTPAGDIVSGRISWAHHGRSLAHRSNPHRSGRFSPLVPGVTHVRYPYVYRGCTGGQQEEEAFSLGCALYIEEKLFKTILPPEEVAAIFVEPIQGEGGFIPAPDNFRASCGPSATGTVFYWFDEVQSGCGRTGKWWAIEDSGVEPDIVCIAKGIASGMPLGIWMTRAEIMDWTPGMDASTFGGNPVSIAAALATMDVLEREGIANAARVGEFMLERVRGWKQSHPLVGHVRGRGLMIGIEIVKDKGTREPAVEWRDRIETRAFERGLIVLRCGRDLAAALASADRQQGRGQRRAGHSGRGADRRGEGARAQRTGSRDGVIAGVHNSPTVAWAAGIVESPRPIAFQGAYMANSTRRASSWQSRRCGARRLRLCAISRVDRRCSSATAVYLSACHAVSLRNDLPASGVRTENGWQ